MHNAAFKASGLTHFHYELYETTDVQEIVDNVLMDPHFGGASVTIPHKISIVPYMTTLSDAAKAIGAVNTIIVKSNEKGKRVFIGDNTDWLGILRPIKKRLTHTSQKSYIALVVGAGGTSMAASYAMQQLGATLYVYNRTLSKAQEVAERFGGHAIAQLTRDTLERVDIVIGTIPADAGFVLPDYLLEETTPNNDSKVIVLDAAYKPSVTPMLAHASSTKYKNRVLCIQGYEMLYEQAGEQFLRWCPPQENKTKAPPKEEMKQAVLQFIPIEERLGEQNF
jgi:pentafunctional AROM polypeptide